MNIDELMNPDDLMNHPIIKAALQEGKREEELRRERYAAHPLAFKEGRRLGEYTLEEACQECDEDSMSEVRYASDSEGNGVVIKRPSLLVAERVAQLAHYVWHEAEVLAKLDHQNIVRLLNVFNVEDPETGLDIPHIVTPELEIDARSFITEEPLMARKSTINEGYLHRIYVVMSQAAEGLSYLHSQGFVHCDFNTSQLMLDGNDVVKIIDLGAAREAGEMLSQANGEMQLTPHYFPKNNDGKPSLERPYIDPSQDLYAFGMSILELLLPATGMDEDTIEQAMLHENERNLIEKVRATNVVPYNLLDGIVKNCFESVRVGQSPEFTAERLKRAVASFAVSRYLTNLPERRLDVMTGEITETPPRHDYRKRLRR